MGTRRFPFISEEENRITAALRVIFAFFDQRGPNSTTPCAVVKAFDIIVTYYTLRLKHVIKMYPSDCIRRVVSPEDLYQYAWLKFWLHGGSIKQRTPAGVCAWLQRVIIHYKLNLGRFCSRLAPWDDLDPEFELSFADARDFMVDSRLLSKTCEDFDAIEFRWQLLNELYEKAMARLNARQQEIIRLDRKPCSLAEIMKIMGFPSVSAASSFKSRSYKALLKQMYLLCVRELDNPRANLDHKAVIEEWLECHHITNRERKRNV